MRKKSRQQFPYTLAAYPLKFHKYVISPQKICIQLSDLQVKTRAPFNQEGLLKSGHGTHLMPIDTAGTDIDCLAVGIPLHLYPEIFENILDAIEEHDKLYPQYTIKKEIKEIIRSKGYGQ